MAIQRQFLRGIRAGFQYFFKYHMKILLGDLNAKVGRKDIFNPTIGNVSLYHVSNCNDVRLVNFGT